MGIVESGSLALTVFLVKKWSGFKEVMEKMEIEYVLFPAQDGL